MQYASHSIHWYLDEQVCNFSTVGYPETVEEGQWLERGISNRIYLAFLLLRSITRHGTLHGSHALCCDLHVPEIGMQPNGGKWALPTANFSYYCERDDTTTWK